MKRREFVGLVASVAATGCLGGAGEDGDGTPDTADFGYTSWVPASEYREVGYVDLAATRELTSPSFDEDERVIVGDARVPYADIDALLTTSGAYEFEAYSGRFEADGIVDTLADAETTEYAGYTVATGTAGGDTVGVAVSGSETVVARGDATRVVDAAVGETERQAESGEVIDGLTEYAETEAPLAVVFDYGVGNTVYQFVEERPDGVFFVEVARLSDEAAARRTIEEDYSYSDGRLEDLNTTVERDGRDIVIETRDTAEVVERAFFGSAGLLP